MSESHEASTNIIQFWETVKDNNANPNEMLIQADGISELLQSIDKQYSTALSLKVPCISFISLMKDF